MIERINADEPSRRVSSEDLGGRPNEQKDPQTKEVVGQLLKIADEMDNDAEFQQWVKCFYILPSAFFFVELTIDETSALFSCCSEV